MHVKEVLGTQHRQGDWHGLDEQAASLQDQLVRESEQWLAVSPTSINTHDVEMGEGSEHGLDEEEEGEEGEGPRGSEVAPINAREQRYSLEQTLEPANAIPFTAEMLPTVVPCQSDDLGAEMLNTIRKRVNPASRRSGGFVMPVHGLPVATAARLGSIRTAINKEIAEEEADSFMFTLHRRHGDHGPAPSSMLYAEAGERPKDVEFISDLGQKSYKKHSFDEQVHDLRLKVQALPAGQTLRLRYYIGELQSTNSHYLETLYDLLRPAGALIPVKGKPIPGITTPYLYYSDESNTPATMHVEDAGLGSVNLLVAGAPKIWLLLPPASKVDFEHLMQRLFPKAKLSSCSQHVRHIGFLILTETLREHKIPYSLAYQEVGDMVVTLADAYHQVINTGPNAAVAINIPDPHLAMCPATYNWCTASCGGNVYIRASLEHSSRRTASRQNHVSFSRTRAQKHTQKTPSTPATFPLLYGNTDAQLEQLAGYCENYTPWWLSAGSDDKATRLAFQSFRPEGELSPSLCMDMLRLLCGDVVELLDPFLVGTAHRTTLTRLRSASGRGAGDDSKLVCFVHSDGSIYGFAYLDAFEKKLLSYSGMHLQFPLFARRTAFIPRVPPASLSTAFPQHVLVSATSP